MSGKAPTVELLPDHGGQVVRLVDALSVLAHHARDRIALIGGVAVACRLGVVHRATQDLDAVTDARPGVPDVTQILVSDAGAVGGDRSHRVVVHGIKVEIIETESLPEALEGVPADQRLFVLSHRWGLLSAASMDIRVAGTETGASVPVATRPALVAMKLHAALDRSDQTKRASDVYDIHRLLQDGSVPKLVEAFASAPHDLATLVVDGMRRLFDSGAERSARPLLVHGGLGTQRITADDLRAVGVAFADALANLGR